MRWRSHRWATTGLYHLLLPCCTTCSFQSTHSIEFIGIGQHEVSRQRIKFLITYTILIDGLHDILFVVQEVIHLECQGRVSPSLIDREVPDQLIDIGQSLVTMA